MEGLEDRLVPSTASQLGSTLNVVASPGTSSTARTILLEVDQINPTKLDVKDNGALLGQFTIASINQVKVQGHRIKMGVFHKIGKSRHSD